MLFTLPVVLAAILGVSYAQATSCTKPSVRKEWRELDASRRKAYLNAVLCLKRVRSIIPGSGSPSRYDDFARAHTKVLDAAHSTPMFLPWHRAYLRAFEDALITQCNYHNALPYWDWSIDSQAPEQSMIWGPKSFGGDGDPDSADSCISDGPFAGFMSTFAQKTCISRTIYDGLPGASSFFTPESIYQLVNLQSTFATFRTNLERGPHNNVHDGIGGSMGRLALSANDPIFFLHHANVDRIWYMWQKKNPLQANSYYGTMSNGRPASKTDIMGLFGASFLPEWTVGMMLDTTSGDPLCYTYTNSIRPGLTSRLSFQPIRKSLSASARKSQPYPALKPIPNPPISAKEISTAEDSFSFGVDNGLSPDVDDREDMTRLRCPSRLSDAMVTQMRLNSTEVQEIRDNENENCAFLNYVNSHYPHLHLLCCTQQSRHE
ncbi:hypothetical protein BASA83_004515 [Batrachochytrium salamandrivorans]|nr:hypothetical protein BASA83_004515 [Batrachochytrium salamandrivorans]